MEKTAFVLLKKDEYGMIKTLLIASDLPLLAGGVNKVNKVLKEESDFTSIINDDYLLMNSTKKELKEEYENFANLVLSGIEAEYYGDTYYWEELSIV